MHIDLHVHFDSKDSTPLHTLLAGQRQIIALLHTILSENRTMATDLEVIGAAVDGLVADQQAEATAITAIAAELAELAVDQPALKSLAVRLAAVKDAADQHVAALQALVPAPPVVAEPPVEG